MEAGQNRFRIGCPEGGRFVCWHSLPFSVGPVAEPPRPQWSGRGHGCSVWPRPGSLRLSPWKNEADHQRRHRGDAVDLCFPLHVSPLQQHHANRASPDDYFLTEYSNTYCMDSSWNLQFLLFLINTTINVPQKTWENHVIFQYPSSNYFVKNKYRL